MFSKAFKTKRLIKVKYERMESVADLIWYRRNVNQNSPTYLPSWCCKMAGDAKGIGGDS